MSDVLSIYRQRLLLLHTNLKSDKTMFGDMMKNMESQQEEMQSTLKKIKVAVAKNGIAIEANAAREILNISIDKDLMEDKEQLEDMLIVAINDITQAIQQQEAVASQDMMSNVLPGGLAGLGDMFSK
ncbi:MAG: YbaB/EbfC family nucleoid-associated protein [Saprospiraceae bacterium]